MWLERHFHRRDYVGGQWFAIGHNKAPLENEDETMTEWKARTGQKIERLYAWIATEPDGGEGVVAHEVTVDNRQMLAPLIGADRARIESFREHARAIGRRSNYPIRLVEYSVRTILDDEP